jgi:hypothetical protein
MENRTLMMEFVESQFDNPTGVVVGGQRRTEALQYCSRLVLATFAGRHSKNIARHAQGGAPIHLQRIQYNNF